MTLVEFLLARLAEDEEAALSVLNNKPYFQQLAWGWFDSDFGDFHLAQYGKDGVGLPARVLAEVEAKRRIISGLDRVEHYAPFEHEWEWCPVARTGPLGDLPGGPGAVCDCAASWPDYKRAPMLRYLAMPYSNHPDFDLSWKPEDET